MSETPPFLPPFETHQDGLSLRMYRTEDAALINEAVNDSYAHLQPWMPWAKPVTELVESEAIVRSMISKYMANEDFVLGIFEGEEFIGGTGFHLRVGPLAWRSAEIGMWIRSSRAGQGYGTRALRILLDWGFGEWGWERLVWKCDTQNLGSMRTAERVGLVREATFRSVALGVDGQRTDFHQYFALRSEWKS